MEKLRRYKTKQEFATELGLSRSTFYRLIHKLNLTAFLSGGLLSPAEQDAIKKALENYKR